MDKKEFEDKWKHLFKIVRDKTIYPADEPTSENILVLMLRDAIEVIEKEPLPKGDDCEETGPNLEEIRSREWFW